MFHDQLYYKGSCEVKGDEKIDNIINARIIHYRLSDYMTFEKGILSICNESVNWNTKMVLVMDLLIFINKHASLTFQTPIFIKEDFSLIQHITPPLSMIFKHKNTLYHYHVDEKWKETTIPLYIEFLDRKKICEYNFTFLSDYPLNTKETRKIDAYGISVPLFEPFMKQKLNIKEKRYFAHDKNLILENDERKSTCFACVHRLKNISNHGCQSCLPVIMKKTVSKST